MTEAEIQDLKAVFVEWEPRIHAKLDRALAELQEINKLLASLRPL